MKLQLISNWRDWWRMTSVWVTALGATILGIIQEIPDAAIHVWSFIPADLKTFLPEGIIRWIGYVVLGIGIVSRLFIQPKLVERKAQRDAELGSEAPAAGAAGGGADG